MTETTAEFVIYIINAIANAQNLYPVSCIQSFT